jgi:hypothetical protein|tara:strand:- start:433 stop:615 length:183 start_codon:yes stop_codon:yes gene_type:complete
MKLSELRSLIHELIRGEVEETSTSGNAGAYNTPFAFSKNKKQRKNNSMKWENNNSTPKTK